MARASRCFLRPLLVVGLLVAAACVDVDLSGLDVGSGTGCYVCYPDPVDVPPIPFEPTPTPVTGGGKAS